MDNYEYERLIEDKDIRIELKQEIIIIKNKD